MSAKVKPTKRSYTQFFGVAGRLVLPKESEAEIEHLIALQCSAKRAIYRFIKANPDKVDGVYKAVYPRYLDLPARYFNAVIALAKQLPTDRKVVFGGQTNWRKYRKGIISKKSWQQRRDNTLYSSAFNSSNELLIVERLPNGRVFLKIRKPNPTKQPASFWVIPMKCARIDELPPLQGYSVRLTRIRGREFKVDITWGVKQTRAKPSAGCIGVDVNPTCIAWTELDAEGNLLRHGSIVLERATSANANKRSNDIILAAIELIKIAVEANKPIVIEKLNFGHGANRGKRKFNRMLHSFCYRSILTAIQRQAAKVGLPVKEVIPAYTSVLGLGKFAHMYKLSRHSAAAMVIGRRGLGIKERINFPVAIRVKGKTTTLAKERAPDSGRNRVPRSTPSLPQGKGQPREQVRLTERSYQHMSAHWCRHSSRAHCPRRAEARSEGRKTQPTLPDLKGQSTSQACSSNGIVACGMAKGLPRFTRKILGCHAPQTLTVKYGS